MAKRSPKRLDALTVNRGYQACFHRMPVGHDQYPGSIKYSFNELTPQLDLPSGNPSDRPIFFY